MNEAQASEKSRILLTEAEKREALEALKLAYQRQLERQQTQK